MTHQDTLADRYGAPAPWRRQALIGLVVLTVLAFGGWLGWTTWEQARPVVASGELTFDIVDDNTATASLRIEFTDDVEAVCTLKAYAEDHTLVGQVDLYPEPGVEGRYEQSISTDRRATSVESVGCTAPGQTRPR